VPPGSLARLSARVVRPSDAEQTAQAPSGDVRVTLRGQADAGKYADGLTGVWSRAMTASAHDSTGVLAGESSLAATMVYGSRSEPQPGDG